MNVFAEIEPAARVEIGGERLEHAPEGPVRGPSAETDDDRSDTTDSDPASPSRARRYAGSRECRSTRRADRATVAHGDRDAREASVREAPEWPIARQLGPCRRGTTAGTHWFHHATLGICEIASNTTLSDHSVCEPSDV